MSCHGIDEPEGLEELLLADPTLLGAVLFDGADQTTPMGVAGDHLLRALAGEVLRNLEMVIVPKGRGAALRAAQRAILRSRSALTFPSNMGTVS